MRKWIIIFDKLITHIGAGVFFNLSINTSIAHFMFLYVISTESDNTSIVDINKTINNHNVPIGKFSNTKSMKSNPLFIIIYWLALFSNIVALQN